MTVFTEVELEYLGSQRLARLATSSASATPDVSAVVFSVDGDQLHRAQVAPADGCGAESPRRRSRSRTASKCWPSLWRSSGASLRAREKRRSASRASRAGRGAQSQWRTLVRK